jgi:hypothetical protein
VRCEEPLRGKKSLRGEKVAYSLLVREVRRPQESGFPAVFVVYLITANPCCARRLS